VPRVPWVPKVPWVQNKTAIATARIPRRID
jgi:hypothetical protein